MTPTQQIKLLTLEENFSVGNLLGLPINPQQRIWLASAQTRGILQPLLETLIQLRAAKDLGEALAYCANVILQEKNLRDSEGISFGDLQLTKPVSLRNHTRTFLGRNAPSETPANICQRMGIASHMLMAWLSQTPRVLQKTEQMGLFDAPVAKEATQLKLFETRNEEQLPMFSLKGERTGPPQNLPSRFCISLAQLAEIERTCAAVLPLTASAEVFGIGRFSNTESLRQFRNAMAQPLLPWVAYLEEKDTGPLAEYFALVTLVSWAQIILREEIYAQGDSVSLNEVPVLPRKYDVHAGRIDRLDVMKLNGFRNSIGKANFPSAYEAIRFFTNRAETNLVGNIRDWKFSAGDFGGMVGDRSMLPLKSHEQQLVWYALWLVLAHEREAGILWEAERFTATLYYLLPDGPVIRQVPSGKPELQKQFRELVVDRYGKIRKTHDARIFERVILRHLRLLEGRLPHIGSRPTFGGPPANRLETTALQERLFPTEKSGRSIEAIIEDHREFADASHIVEKIGNDGEDTEKRYMLHIDALRKAIANGSIKANESAATIWAQDEFSVSCPLHDDKTPSLRMYRNHGFCFSCRTRFPFAYQSIPEDLNWIMPGDPGANGRRRKVQDIQVSDEHRQVMEIAQAALQRGCGEIRFWEYITETRKIDVEIARHYGAGLGSDRVWSDLFDAGYDFATLARYGWIEFRDYQSRSGEWFHNALIKRGVPSSELVRTIKIKEMGREVTYYAYFPWTNRITVPLVVPVDGKPVINSFYGRATWPNAGLKHRKSRILKVDVSHGLMNGAALIAPPGTLDAVYITEGYFDALVLLTMMKVGTAVVSFCGTGNDQGVAWVAHAKPKVVREVLDFDTAGKKATAKIAQHLNRHGFTGTVEDYCTTFSRLHEEVDLLLDDEGKPVIDDLGKWWQVISEDDRRLYVRDWYEERERTYFDPSEIESQFDEDNPF